MVATALSAPSLYDTNILIDYLGGIQAARTELSGAIDPAISTVTWIEVMAEFHRRLRIPFADFYGRFVSWPLLRRLPSGLLQSGGR